MIDHFALRPLFHLSNFLNYSDKPLLLSLLLLLVKKCHSALTGLDHALRHRQINGHAQLSSHGAYEN